MDTHLTNGYNLNIMEKFIYVIMYNDKQVKQVLRGDFLSNDT